LSEYLGRSRANNNSCPACIEDSNGAKNQDDAARAADVSKKFRNKACAYCGAPASTADHVIAREFLPEYLRRGLPKVPECQTCNRIKSGLEHYLVTVLPLGSDHAAAIEGVRKLDARLAKNLRLADELRAGFLERADGRPTLPFQGRYLSAFSALVVRGLVYHELGIVIDNSRFRVEGDVLREGGQAALSRLQRDFGASATEIRRTFADGAVEYAGYIARDHSPVSLWRIRLLGGIKWGNTNARAEGTGDEFGGIVLLAQHQVAVAIP